jgi:hypothetical protein
VAADGDREDTGDALFDGCDAVAEATIVDQRIAPVPIEARAAAATWADDAADGTRPPDDINASPATASIWPRSWSPAPWKKPPPGPKSFQTRSEHPRGGDGTVPGPGPATRAKAPRRRWVSMGP